MSEVGRALGQKPAETRRSSRTEALAAARIRDHVASPFAEDINGVWHVRSDEFWDDDIGADVRAHAACGAGIWSCHVSSYPPILSDPKARHCRGCFPIGRKRSWR